MGRISNVGGSGGSGLTTTSGDARYLRLDTSNGPLTGRLTINPATGDAEIFLTTNGTNRGRLVGEGGSAVVLRSEAAIYFQTGGNSTRISILSGGKVGINKFTPTENLDVVGNFLVEDTDVTTKAYRFRTTGSALDFDIGGANMTFSGYPNADFSGTQKVYLIMGSTFDFVTAQGNWEWKDRAGGNVQHSINADGSVIFNQNSASKIVTIKGNTDATLFVTDAVNNRIGIGTAGPAVKLDVVGEIRSSVTGTNAASVVLVGGVQTLTNKTLTSPAINTPTGIVKGDVGLGNVDNTSNATERAATATLTNKRITQRIVTEASNATPTPNADTTDEHTITALAAAAAFAVPSGTPTEGQKLIIRIKDNGTARALSFNGIYRFSSDLAAPTTTVISKTMYLGFIYNNTDTKWDNVSQMNNF